MKYIYLVAEGVIEALARVSPVTRILLHVDPGEEIFRPMSMKELRLWRWFVSW